MATCGGVIGGKSKPKSELVTAPAVIKAARLNFIEIAPGVKLIRKPQLMGTRAYRDKRRFNVIPLTLHINVCLGESPRSQGDPNSVYGRW